MQVTFEWWTRGRSARHIQLVCLVMMMIASPFLVHADEVTAHFDIKAQALSEALMAFGVQTGTIVIASSDLTTGKISKLVAGQLTSREALIRMLQGTGLKFETNANGNILIARATSPGS